MIRESSARLPFDTQKKPVGQDWALGKSFGQILAQILAQVDTSRHNIDFFLMLGLVPPRKRWSRTSAAGPGPCDALRAMPAAPAPAAAAMVAPSRRRGVCLSLQAAAARHGCVVRGGEGAPGWPLKDFSRRSRPFATRGAGRNSFSFRKSYTHAVLEVLAGLLQSCFFCLVRDFPGLFLGSFSPGFIWVSVVLAPAIWTRGTRSLLA